MKRLKSDEVRKNWAEILLYVRNGGEVVVEHYNRPVARILPLQEPPMTERWIPESSRHQQTVDRAKMLGAENAERILRPLTGEPRAFLQARTRAFQHEGASHRQLASALGVSKDEWTQLYEPAYVGAWIDAAEALQASAESHEIDIDPDTITRLDGREFFDPILQVVVDRMTVGTSPDGAPVVVLEDRRGEDGTVDVDQPLAVTAVWGGYESLADARRDRDEQLTRDLPTRDVAKYIRDVGPQRTDPTQ